jgi:hypothetical protein
MRSDCELRPETIEKLATAVYPSMAMMAGIQLDVFTPLKDGPLNAGQVAAVRSIDPARAAPLLYALVAIGLLTVDGDRFVNTPEADYFLVRGRPSYIGMRSHAYQRRWQAMLHAAESIRTGTPQGRFVEGLWTEPTDESPSVARWGPRLLAGCLAIRAVAEGPPICRG